MSRLPINLNPDLQRLRDEGFEIEIRSNLLLVHSVPYANSRSEVDYGVLVSELTTASPGVLDKPGTHQIHFIGEHPCRPDGTELVQIKHSSGTFPLAEGITAFHYFSNKPRSGSYSGYYEKIVGYVRVISDQARGIDPSVDARTFKTVAPAEEDESVFLYEDTASSRAGIQIISATLKSQRVAIVGLGGTGAYVLDLVSKTHVREIHLYDGDSFRPHNAFRFPGAASRKTLDRRQTKVGYLADNYANMRTGIVPHAYMIDENNASDLTSFDFVFICVDRGSARQLILQTLDQTAVRFVDVGMGVVMTDDKLQLWGTSRVTTSTPQTRSLAAKRIPKVDREDALYGSNIQIADLNCINAALAVFKWKRLSGFYLDDRDEFDSTFNIGLNQLTNEEQPL